MYWYAKTEKVQLKNLDDRSRMLVHLGTEPGSKAYRMLDTDTRKIVVNRDVVFDESKGWNWKTSSLEQAKEFVVSLGDFGNHGIHRKTENDDNGGENERRDHIEDDITEEESPREIEDATEVITLRRSERQSVKEKYIEDYVMLAEEEGETLLLYLNNEPRTFQEASELKEWIMACEDELRSIIKNEVWSLVDLPNAVKSIGLRWIFKIKHNSDGTINKYKARLVVKGYVQQHEIDFEEVFAPVA